MNNNDNSQSLLKVKNVTLKPNFKTKSLNFLDFTFYYFAQQKSTTQKRENSQLVNAKNLPIFAV